MSALLPVLALAWLAAPAQAAPASVAALDDVKGIVRITRAADGDIDNGVEDAPLYEGDEVRTDLGARVTITFVDHHLLKLSEKSTLKIKTVKLDPKKGTFLGRVRLLGGKLFASVSRAAGAPKSAFAVETRTTVAAVKGTTFGVEEDETASTVSVLEGTVSAAPVDESGKEGAPVDVPEGQETTVDTKSRRLGGVRSFLDDAKRGGMKEELASMKGFASQFREMKRTGELDQLRELRGLARGGNLLKAGPKLRKLLLTRPGLRQQLLEHADRHRKNLMRRADHMKLRGQRPAHEAGPGQEREHQEVAPAGESNVQKGINRLKGLRRKPNK